MSSRMPSPVSCRLLSLLLAAAPRLAPSRFHQLACFLLPR